MADATPSKTWLKAFHRHFINMLYERWPEGSLDHENVTEHLEEILKEYGWSRDG